MFTLPILIFLNESCPMFIICFCFVVFSVHSNCSEIWGLSTPNTIEQWDTSGLYSYPDQTRWLSSTIVWCCINVDVGELSLQCCRWQTLRTSVSYFLHHSTLFIFLLYLTTPPHPFLCSLFIFHPSHHHLLFAVQSDHWTAACRSPTGRGFLT